MLLPKRTLISSQACLLCICVWASACFAQSAPAAEPAPLWKTIQIGTFRNIIALREALENDACGTATPVSDAGHALPAAIPCKLGDSANEIIGRTGFALSGTPRQIELALVSGQDLGFSPDSQPSLREIYERAVARGYSLCPPEAGPQLRLQYVNQKIGEFLHIAMQPIRDYAGDLTVFSVGNGGAGLLLVGSSGSPETPVPATVSFVFTRSTIPSTRELARGGEVVDR
jgi:hypothetical protein